MPQSSIAPFRFSLGRGANANPREQQRPLLPAASQSCAFSRLNLRPATISLGSRPGGRYACLATPGGTSVHGSGTYSGGEESGDEEDGVTLPQHTCSRCCLGLCLLMMIVTGTGLVLRFLIARDGHPSSPAAKLASLSARRAPPSVKTTSRTAVALGASTRRRAPPPPPSPQRLGSEVFLVQGYAPPPSPPPPLRYAQGDEFPESDASLRAAPPPGHPWPYLKVPPPPPPWPPWPPVGLSPHPPAARSPPPPPWPPVFSPPSPPMFATATPPDARSAELALALQTFAERNASRPPPSPLREMGALTIPAVAARVAAEARKRRAKNQTRV